MKVLISSVACCPYGASEGIYGWRACRAIARDHDVFIITSIQNRKQIDQARSEGLVPASMHFRFASRPHNYSENRMLARFQSWKEYVDFNKEILPMARCWHEEEHFDLSHLVTYTTWRVGCQLRKLPIPLVWGPISGTEVFPTSCMGTLSAASWFFEAFRKVADVWSAYSLDVRQTIRTARVIPVTHSQALDVLSKMRGNRLGMFLFCNVFFGDENIRQLARKAPSGPSLGPLRIFGSGNLEGRKGVAIALQALSIAKGKGLRFHYTISSRGPELEHLQKLAIKLGLKDDVSLGHPLSREEYHATLKSSDIYFLPSLREGAGQTLMEAMLAGCAPLVADWCGPAEIVTDECGFKVPVSEPRAMAATFADILLNLDQNRENIRRVGVAASERIRTAFNEDKYLHLVNESYNIALS